MHRDSRGSGGKGGGSFSQCPPQPRRGPPAIFVTCESGREKKCRRESLELINHYYYLSGPSSIREDAAHNNCDGKIHITKISAAGVRETAKTNSSKEKEEQLSLEEELGMLHKGVAAEEVLSYEQNSKRPRYNSNNSTCNEKTSALPSNSKISSMKSPFSIYDAGIRGMVCIVCTLPGCELIPYDDILVHMRELAKEDSSLVSKGEKGQDDTLLNENSSNDEEEKTSTGLGRTGEHENENLVSDKLNDSINDVGSKLFGTSVKPPSWDSVETVKCIMGGVKTDVSNKVLSSPSPGSRFVSRVIPIQATVRKDTYHTTCCVENICKAVHFPS